MWQKPAGHLWQKVADGRTFMAENGITELDERLAQELVNGKNQGRGYRGRHTRANRLPAARRSRIQSNT